MTSKVQYFAFCAAAPLLAGAGDNAVLRAEIERLEHRIAALEQSEADGTIASKREAELRALVTDVLHDAEHRASLLDHGMLAGHDGTFYIASANGNFRMDIAGQIQARFVYNRQSRSPEDDHRAGMEMRRVQLKFEGHIIDPRLRYKLQGGVNRINGEFALLDAEIGWAFAEGWLVRAGQFRPRFLREDSTSSTRQLAVERSLVNARFAQNRMQAVELQGRVNERWRVSGVVSDGLRSRNVPWQEPAVEFAFTGRTDWLLAGSWRQFNQFTSPRDDEFGMMFGAAIHYQRDPFGIADDDPRLDILRWTVDGQLSFGGASISGAWIASHESVRDAGSAFRWGFFVQGAARLTDEWELFVRYECGDLDEVDAATLSVLTAGVNWYFDEHRLKWTTDVGIGLNPVDPGWVASSAGWRADSPGRSGQVVVRSQVQLLF